MARAKPLPSVAEILERFIYDEVTGIFYHTKGGRKGKPAGGKDKDGISLYFGNLGRFKAHRIAWRLKTGEDPEDSLIDHKDQDPFHNAWSNLRKATDMQNSYNSSGWDNSTTGVKGVTLTHGKFKARIRANGERMYIGTFNTLEEAAEAVKHAREVYHGEFANNG